MISLAPNLTEILCAIGAETQLVGRTSACDYPPEKVAAIPVIGGFGAPSLELLLKLQPTLVLEVDLADAALGAAIDQAGLTRRHIACSTLDDIPRAIMTVGRLTRSEDAARAVAEPIHRRIADLRQAAAARKASGQPIPSVFVEIWGEPLTTCGKQSFVSDLVTLAGGRNLGDDASEKPYFAVSTEWLIARNPDVIICLDMNGAGETEGQRSPRRPVAGPREPRGKQVHHAQDVVAPCGFAATGEVRDQPALRSLGEAGRSEKLDALNGYGPAWKRAAARTGWAGIAAVKNRRVYGRLDNNVILRPGPRVLDGIEALRQCIEERPRRGDMGRGGQGDGETKRQEDTETRRQDEKEE